MVNLTLVDDYIWIEEVTAPLAGGIMVCGSGAKGAVVRAKVLAVGPGEQGEHKMRSAMPCTVGDTVLVHAGAGIKFTDQGIDYWFVYGGRKDILAVVAE